MDRGLKMQALEREESTTAWTLEVKLWRMEQQDDPEISEYEQRNREPYGQ